MAPSESPPNPFLGVEGQTLVGGGSGVLPRGGSRRPGGGGNGGGGNGASSAPIPESRKFYASAMAKWALFLGLLALAATYLLVLEAGEAKKDANPEDWEEKPLAKRLGERLGFRARTLPPVPTPAPTPLPTFGNSSWVPEPNPYVEKFNTTEYAPFFKKQWEARAKNAIDINEKYGIYCPKDPAVPMCPKLEAEGKLPNSNELAKGPTVKCIDTGDKKERCGINTPWLNKTIWPLLRGPFCAEQDAERKKKFPLPAELAPYWELGYDKADPTKSTEAKPFDGGAATNNLPFDPTMMKEHFLKFEAMLEHYYEGLARPLLERHLAPMPEDPLYAPMLKAYADQIARALLRAKEKGRDGGEKVVIGVLGDSVTSGTDDCYYDAWPEVLRRQLAPLFAGMGLTVEVRNAAKNGGWNLPSQFLCAHDMLGASDRNGAGLDFLFVCNPFVKANLVDAEHMIRRALLGASHTVVSITVQNNMSKEDMLSKYAAAGLTIGTPLGNVPPELGIPDKGYKFWFPNQDRAFWGMNGDGFCHLTTRAGSSAVVNRNWHWGPKLHEQYADAYALLLSRATRQAIDELAAGRSPWEPRKPADVEQVSQKKEDQLKEKEGKPPTWKDLLFTDLGAHDTIGGGIGGVRCAIGSANQPGSTLLPHWLRPAEGSPFEEKMKARNGTSFVPSNHEAIGGNFYKRTSPISPPNKAVEVGDWVMNPKGFGAEAPRTVEQCRHVDGSTLVNMRKPEGVSWLVWEIPKGAMTIGRAMMCHPGKSKMPEDALEKGNVRFHYAVPNGNGGWKISEDSHKEKPIGFFGEECTPIVREMNEADLKASREGGMWVAVEWKQEAIFDFDYLVAM